MVLVDSVNPTLNDAEELYNEGYEFELNDGCVVSILKVTD